MASLPPSALAMTIASEPRSTPNQTRVNWNVLRLTTFGGIRLMRGREDLTGAATQRRRLAILSVLAVAGERGWSRDKLLGLLWPESETEKARHVLNQLLYAQRQFAGKDSLFLGKKTLRLNPEVIWTDVGAFEVAVNADAVDEALGYYHGPFLDGFFVANAPGFDTWAESQRQRLRQCLLDRLRARAARFDAAREWDESVRWWRRVTDLDQLDSQASRKLAGALAATGDTSGAIRSARRFRELLMRELGLDVDPAFARWLEELEAGSIRPSA